MTFLIELNRMLELAGVPKLNEALVDRQFEVVKAGSNGGKVGEIIDGGWFVDPVAAPYYLKTRERAKLNQLKVGETMHIFIDDTAHEITVKRVE